ncbi:MAG: aldehyde dehydrogenase family protein [Acidimicrobiaceae bacterium]|nr:aldehyde dehydrogenase family protein [Acidimicrobiaceae bacterium]MBT5579949.1 aldehyde dehydrogenase family protein [Acidimicrobiaceae bacterium]MBT5852087.1 aldehyde dehydrogenase family protein [Acidimicrobiaceae bacterium]
MAKNYQLLIGGEWVDGENGTTPVLNPADESLVGEAPEASERQARDAAAAAQDAFPGWAATPARERAALLHAAAEKLKERRDRLVPLIISETGATANVGSRMQVPVAIARLREYAELAVRDHDIALPPNATPATPLAPGGLIGGVVARQPVGAVATISPYNFPLVNQAGKVAPALAAGCTVVMKPAPQDPFAVIELAEVLDEVGVPAGVVNIVTSAAPEPAAALSGSGNIDMVSFTGSTGIGERIYESGASTMKRLLLELGGKGAAIVCDDADLKAAIGAIASVWGFHSGQICTAPTRVIVHKSRVDELVGGLEKAAGHMRVGDPNDPKTIVGPVISAAQRGRIEGYIDGGAAQGATLLIDGRRPEHLEKGFYVGPTLLTDCTPDMTIVKEEVFGPVVAVLTYDDDDEAVALANGGEFGLYDYVFSGDTGRAYGLARRLRTGNVGVNTAQRNPNTAFGGFKMSGIGRDGAVFGLHAYTELQSIVWPA